MQIVAADVARLDEPAVLRALGDLDDATAGQLVRDADAAFALGWQLARDAGPLVFATKPKGVASEK